MNDSQPKPTEAEAFLCWALIGLYLFVLAVGSLFLPIMGFILSDLLRMSWNLLTALYTAHRLPTASEIYGCASLALLGGGAFLFPQYWLRLRSRPILVGRRGLWLLTAAHALGIILWVCYGAWLERRMFIPDGILVLLAICAVPFLVFVSALVPLFSRNERILT